MGDFKADGSPQVASLWTQSQKFVGLGYRRTVAILYRWPSPLGLCCSPDWPTSSRTGAGCSWPSLPIFLLLFCYWYCVPIGTSLPHSQGGPTRRPRGFQPPTPSGVLRHGVALIPGESHPQPPFKGNKFASPRDAKSQTKVHLATK